MIHLIKISYTRLIFIYEMINKVKGINMSKVINTLKTQNTGYF